jgi:CheY-like chemotaxis protein
MAKILVIDDSPIRARPLVKAGHDVKLACGYDQCKFWLDTSGVLFDLIIMDHDMPGFDGTQLLNAFGDFIKTQECPVWVWSHNTPKAKAMADTIFKLGIRVNLGSFNSSLACGKVDSILAAEPHNGE